MAEHRFHTPALRRVEIGVPAGAVEVETADDEESLVVVEGDDRHVEHTTVELRGDVLVVEYEAGGFFGIRLGGSLQVRARVPHGVEVRLNTAAADLTVHGRIGALAVKTASGDVELLGEVEREAVVKTVSGDVELGEIAGELRVQTVSGD